MIRPEEYNGMAAGKAPAPDARDRCLDTPADRLEAAPDARDRCLDTPADRLEAAIDACLAASADADSADAASAERRRAVIDASPVPTLTQRLSEIRPRFTCVFSCSLSWMRRWLGDGYTKKAVAELFRDKVVKRYIDGGWGECTADCGAPSARMTFRFSIRTKEETSLYARGASAMAELGAILVVERRGGANQESTVVYLEDLRMAARCMRFDNEALRRELFLAVTPDEDPDDRDDGDGYYPPFEGSPDDDNFGNG